MNRSMKKQSKSRRSTKPPKRSPDEKKLLFLEFLLQNSGWYTRTEVVRRISTQNLGKNNAGSETWLASINQLKEKKLIKTDVQKVGGSLEYTVYSITDQGLELLKTIKKWKEEDNFFMIFNLFHILD
jgi:DNA-binding PadR family transcriptional regulator